MKLDENIGLITRSKPPYPAYCLDVDSTPSLFLLYIQLHLHITSHGHLAAVPRAGYPTLGDGEEMGIKPAIEERDNTFAQGVSVHPPRN